MRMENEACVVKEVKGTLGIHGGSYNHNMASDFRVSSRNENTDVRCMAEKGWRVRGASSPGFAK